MPVTQFHPSPDNPENPENPETRRTSPGQNLPPSATLNQTMIVSLSALCLISRFNALLRHSQHHSLLVAHEGNFIALDGAFCDIRNSGAYNPAGKAGDDAKAQALLKKCAAVGDPTYVVTLASNTKVLKK